MLAGSTSTTISGGYQVAQQGKPLRHQLSRENIHSSQVATGPGEAGDKAEPDRVFSYDEKDRDNRGSVLRRNRRSVTLGCDNCSPSASQIDSKSRQSIDFILGRTVQDRHVLAFDKTCLLEALLESAQLVLVRCLGEESNHWHRWLLCLRRERPRCRRATKQRDELAPM